MIEEKDVAAWRARILEELNADQVEDTFRDGASGSPRGLESQVEVLAFRLGSETFGFDIQEVSEILRPKPITSLPRCPEAILGVLSLRGMILPVADTARRLGIGAFDGRNNHRIIVVNDGAERMGFAVDAVVGVLRFARSDLENNQFGASVDPAFLVGIGYDSKRQLVALLSTEKLCDIGLEAK